MYSSEQSDVHRDQRPFGQRQATAACKIEHRILAAGAAAKPGMLGETQRAVVVERAVRPRCPGGSHRPAQVVLATAPLCRMPSRRRVPQRARLGRQHRVVVEGSVAAVQTHFMSSLVNRAHQPLHARIAEIVVAIELLCSVLRYEVEGALQPHALGDRQHEVEGVDRLVAPRAGSGARARCNAPHGHLRVTPDHQVGGRAAQHGRP